MLEPEFSLSLIRPREGRVVVAVRGEIDICSSIALREQLKQLVATCKVVVIDLSQVRFMDSTGLGCLVTAAHRAPSSGCTLALVAPRPSVQHVIETTGIDQIIPIFPTAAEALRSA